MTARTKKKAASTKKSSPKKPITVPATPPKKLSPLENVAILTWKERSGTWIAAWSRFDLLAQGDTEKQAVERLYRTIAQQALWDARDGNLETFGTARKPSCKLLCQWQEMHKSTHAEDL